MKLKTNGGNFPTCSEQTGSAVCVDVTQPKTVQTQYGPKEKFRFVFEIGQMKDDGTPWCVWSAPFTPSYHENSALRPFHRKWTGQEMTTEEIKNFDTEDLLGRPAHITVIHERRGDEVFANIALIQPDKSATPLKPSGKFVRLQKTGRREDNNSYQPAEQPVGDDADLGATKIHIGKCKGLEFRDLAPEQLQALVTNWLPTAKSNLKPTADDQRLVAALEQCIRHSP